MHTMLTKVLALLSLSLAVHAVDIQEYEGKLTFEKGAYVLQQSRAKQFLSGLSLAQLRHFEGQQVKIFAHASEQGLEIYKVLRKQGQEYVAAYDWEVVNNDLYE